MELIDFKGFRTFTDLDAAIVREKARETIITFLREHNDHPVLLLLSGGSAVELLREIPLECFSSDITISVLDERYSRDEAVNNFAQLQKTDFYKAAVRAGAHTIDTFPRAEETSEMLARRFEGELKGWMENNPSSLMVATMGIGEDGHTAGIMPYPEDEQTFHTLFEDPASLVCGYDAGGKNQYPLRITTTITFLKTIDHSIVFCVGESKREALTRVLADEGTCAETPARVIRNMKDATLFTDIT